MRSRTDKIMAVSILIGAFLLRLAFILQTRRLPFYYHPVLDAGFFSQWAAFKANASWFDPTPAFRDPFYAYFLASVYSVLRESLTVARIVQAGLAGLTALAIYSTARAAFGRIAGLAAGVIFALSGLAIFFAAEINEATLLVFLLAASSLLLVRARASRPLLNCAFSGVLLGAALLTRFAAVAALPAWIAYLIATKERRLRQASVLLVAGFLILPLVYHIVMVKGSDRTVVPVRTSWHAFLGSGSVGGVTKQAHFDVEVLGGQPDSRATVSPDWIDGQKDALRLAKTETGLTPSYGAASSHWAGRALRDFASSPGRYLKTYFTKLGLFWGPSAPAANVDSRYLAGNSILLKNVLFAFGVIAPLGLVGMMRRGGSLAHLAIFVPLYSLVACLYLVTDSDKVVVIPFLAVFAGALVGEIVTGAAALRLRRCFTYGLVVAVLGVILLFLPTRPVDRARQLVIQGDIYREEAIFDKAEDAYREAIGISADTPDAYLALSKISSGAWKAEEGLAVLETAVGQAARSPRLLIEKASLLVMLNRPDEALAAVRTLPETYPYEPKLHEVIGLSLLAKGDRQGALAELDREIDCTGGSFVTFSAMGQARLELGQYPEASGYLEQAMRLNPSNTGVAMLLADAYNKQGQYLKACEVLSKVLANDPGNIPLRFKFANSLYKAERYKDAAQQFRELANFDPRNADIVLNLGTVYAAMDSTDLAIAMWEKALELDPSNELARQNLKEVGAAK
jgi:tetratricopeptide (TPR) repeat protein/4-amino-4-deoxy-L-arabinose transferase-like glycosyltransferase